MVSRFPMPRRTWFDWMVFASVFLAHLGYWGGSAVFAVVALVRQAHGEPAPSGDELMRTSESWPPLDLPSWPFWVSMPLLVVAVARTVRATAIPSSWSPTVTAVFALLGGVDGLLFAVAFLDTPEWPRDSVIPGTVLCIAGIVGLCNVLVRHVLSAAIRRTAAQHSREHHVSRSER
jgi:hypothetical protein